MSDVKVQEGKRCKKKPLHFLRPWQLSEQLDGVVAQLVERLVRNEKVRGSTPLGSTTLEIII